MNKCIIILILSLSSSSNLIGQHLFFIGEQSYPCTETFELKSNADKFYIHDLNVVFAKNGKMAFLGISTKTEDVIIRDKLIIYLGDGTVLSLSDQNAYDYVDKVASALYHLNTEELDKLKTSNIVRVRFTLQSEDGSSSAFGGNFSASNKGRSKIDFPAIIGEFYK